MRPCQPVASMCMSGRPVLFNFGQSLDGIASGQVSEKLCIRDFKAISTPLKSEVQRYSGIGQSRLEAQKLEYLQTKWLSAARSPGKSLNGWAIQLLFCPKSRS